MGTSISSVFQEAAQAEEQAAQKEKRVWIANRENISKFTADELPPETKDKSSPMQDGRRNGLHKKQSRRKIVCRVRKLRMGFRPGTGKAKNT